MRGQSAIELLQLNERHILFPGSSGRYWLLTLEGEPQSQDTVQCEQRKPKTKKLRKCFEEIIFYLLIYSFI